MGKILTLITVFSRIVLRSTIRNNELGLDTTVLFECHYYSNFRVRGKNKVHNLLLNPEIKSKDCICFCQPI